MCPAGVKALEATAEIEALRYLFQLGPDRGDGGEEPRHAFAPQGETLLGAQALEKLKRCIAASFVDHSNLDLEALLAAIADSRHVSFVRVLASHPQRRRVARERHFDGTISPAHTTDHIREDCEAGEHEQGAPRRAHAKQGL